MDKVWLTVELVDCEKEEIDLTPEGTFTFKAESAGNKYGFVLELFKPINKEGSSWSLKGRNPVFSIAKTDDDQEEYWPRLQKVHIKNPKLTIDWSKWVDEDEANDAPELAGQDMQGFGGQGGMPGMGGMGGMPGMEGMGGMGGMPGMGGAGGMDMEALQKMMGQMGGAGGMPGMEGMGGMGGMPPGFDPSQMGGMMGGPDSDDEDEEEAAGEPHKAGLADLEGDVEKPIQE